MKLNELKPNPKRVKESKRIGEAQVVAPEKQVEKDIKV